MGNQSAQVQDQTTDDAKSLVQGFVNTLGTGLFLVTMPLSESPPYSSVEIVEGITYKDFKFRGESSVATKWVPESTMTGDDLKKARASNSCGGGCPSGFCRNHECICHIDRCR